MTKKIIVLGHVLIRGVITTSEKLIEKNMDEEITIGRQSGTDIGWVFSWISRKHGRIFLEKGIFNEHLDYEDYSSFGTTVLHWNKHNNGVETEFVHNKKVKIKPGDWLILCKEGKEGVVMQVLVK